MKTLNIDVFKLLGSQSASTQEEGHLLYDRIVKALDETNTIVILDWDNISSITPTFLNVAVGQLMGKYKDDFFSKIVVKNISNEGFTLLKKVIKNAKHYFKININIKM